jgi:hypothetical protein
MDTYTYDDSGMGHVNAYRNGAGCMFAGGSWQGEGILIQ